MSASLAARILRGIALLAAIALAGCTRLPTYRYEIIVEVETPQGLRRGSSIIEVRTRLEPKLLPDMRGYDTRVRGEAVAVDLPAGQTLFATLEGDSWEGSAEIIAVVAATGNRRTPLTSEDISHVRLELNRPRVVPRDAYPILVKFRDINSPSTMETVNPDRLEDNFGRGIRLRRIIVRGTEARPRYTLQTRLRWLSQQVLMGAKTRSGVTMALGPDDFQRR